MYSSCTPWGIVRPVNDIDERTKAILARLRRVEGQIRGIQAMITERRDCQDVVTQFSAATRALERAGYSYFAATLAECALDPDQAETVGYTAERLEQLFMQLA
jgi:DNA-binding FrmR family transcriptional regulator